MKRPLWNVGGKTWLNRVKQVLRIERDGVCKERYMSSIFKNMHIISSFDPNANVALLAYDLDPHRQLLHCDSSASEFHYHHLQRLVSSLINLYLFSINTWVITSLTHVTAPLVLRQLRFLLPSQPFPLYTPVAPLLSPQRPLALLRYSLAVLTAWLALVLLWLVLLVSLLSSYRHKREGGLFVQFSWICPEISIRTHFDNGSFLWNI